MEELAIDFSRSRIKAAIEEDQPCPEIATGDCVEYVDGPCKVCGGSGRVAGVVPGAHLECGQHLRVE